MRESKVRPRDGRPGKPAAAGNGVQYTIRSVPREVDAALRRRAASRGTSLNDALLDVLREGVGLDATSQTHHDLDHLAGAMRPDAKLDRVFEEMRQVDEALWR